VSFAEAEAESRERLTESLSMLNHLRNIAPSDRTPLDDLQKAQRGLWLVSLYAALERGTNAVVEAALTEVSSHGTRNIDCIPAIHSIIQFPNIQSLKDCGYNRVFDSSVRLFDSSFGHSPVNILDNPLAEYLQNIDGNTLIWICGIFGTSAYVMEGSNRGRLTNLRERRNAVAHGREAASKVGERYNLEEMARLYEAVDAELTRFRLHMADYCEGKHYVRNVA
jgi:hypothetical protein